MEIQEYKDVIELNSLANSWLKDYKDNKLGKISPKLKKQFQEMTRLSKKTGQIMEQHSGEEKATDWKTLYAEIETKAKTSPLFAICFGNADDALSGKPTLDAKETVIAIALKKMASAWFGQFGEEVRDEKVVQFITNIYDQAQKIMLSPKKATEDMITLQFFGSDNKQSRKMKRKMKFIANEYAGIVNVEVKEVTGDDKSLKKIGVENLPAMLFKRGKKHIATHEGELSISAIQSKVNVLVEGANISNSSSVPSIKDLKSINKKELYGLGEFLLFYFDTSWCGICKKTTPVIEAEAKVHSNVKFEHVTIDGSTQHHKSFKITQVPSLVFVRDGDIIGRHTGYINPSTLKKKMEEFAVSKKRKIGKSKSKHTSELRIAQESAPKKEEEKQ